MENCPNCKENMVVENQGVKVCFSCGFLRAELTESDLETMPDFYKAIMVEDNGSYWIPQYYNSETATLYLDVDKQWVLTPKVPIEESEKALFPEGETMKSDVSKSMKVPMNEFGTIVTQYFILQG